MSSPVANNPGSSPKHVPYETKRRIMKLRRQTGCCLNCGEQDHLDDSCPHSAFVPPTNTATPSTSGDPPKKNKRAEPQPLRSIPILPSHAPRFDEYSGPQPPRKANPYMSMPIPYDDMYHGGDRYFAGDYHQSGGYAADWATDYQDNRPPFNEHLGPQPAKKAKPCDCEIVCVTRSLLKYTEGIARCLEVAGLDVDILLPNIGIPLATILYNIKLRGVPYAALVNPTHEKTCSVTVNILHGNDQEHRNLPVEEAINLLAKDFENRETKRQDKANAEFNKEIINTCDICGSESHTTNKCKAYSDVIQSGVQGNYQGSMFNPGSMTNPGQNSKKKKKKKNIPRKCSICRAVGHRARDCNPTRASKSLQTPKTNQSDANSNKPV